MQESEFSEVTLTHHQVQDTIPTSLPWPLIMHYKNKWVEVTLFLGLKRLQLRQPIVLVALPHIMDWSR